MALTLVDLPNAVIAHIGRSLAFSDRKACVLAAKGLRHVHETYTFHRLKFDFFETETAARLSHLERIIARILELKPSLDSMHLTFSDFEFVHNLGSRLRACVPQSVAVEILLENCGPRFTRDVIWRRECKVTFYLKVEKDVATVTDMLSTVDRPHMLLCSDAVFRQLDAITLRRIEAVTVDVSSTAAAATAAAVELNLQHVDPARTRLRIAGSAMSANVTNAQNVSEIVCSAFSSVHALIAPFRALTRARSRVSFVVVSLLDSFNVEQWCDLLDNVPTTAQVYVIPVDAVCLRVLDHLTCEGFQNVILYITNRNLHVIGRLVQLVTRSTVEYNLRFAECYADVVDTSIDRLTSIQDVRALMDDVDLNQWYFTKFM